MKVYFFFFLFAFFFVFGFSQKNETFSFPLKWNNSNIYFSSTQAFLQQHFEGSNSSELYPSLVAFQLPIALKSDEIITVSLNSVATKTVDIAEPLGFSLQNDFIMSVEYLYSRGEKTALIRIEAFRQNMSQIERLDSFSLNIQKNFMPKIIESKARVYAANSVLAYGDWYKIGVSQSGIYKITSIDLLNMGFSDNNLITSNIRVYGNGGGMLAEANNLPRLDDLIENAIEIVDINHNGLMETDDYLLFYGSSPNQWKYNASKHLYDYTNHLYDDQNYYFITLIAGNGKRIENDPNNYPASNVLAQQFQDYAVHENDSLNLIKSGKEWYGELFDVDKDYSFNFNFPNIVSNQNITLKTNIIARSTSTSSIKYQIGGTSKIFQFTPVNSNYLADFATEITDTIQLKSASPSINVNLQYFQPSNGGQAWLNYIELNAWRTLSIAEPQLRFQNPQIISQGGIAEYQVQNANASLQIWDISNPLKPIRVNGTLAANTYSFKSLNDTLRTFITHNGSYFTPQMIGIVENQNLHSLSKLDYVIIYHPLFKSQAEQLADIHRNKNGFNVLTINPQMIYNEFSSGTTDIAAIRDFMKMLYDKAAGNLDDMPKYLLFFGDASYDYKNRISNNTNMLPTFESSNTLSPTESYTTDDFFGLLDDSEGASSNGSLDIGIGRFPVTNVEQANNILNKISRYINPDSIVTASSGCNTGVAGAASMSDWRNIVCFIGDDEEGQVHTSQADYLANYTNSNYPQYNIDKIFFDAYTQIITPGGQRYPEVKTAIAQRVAKGALVINYTGHGGEEGWAHESVLEVDDINSWKNYYNLPLFVTATCEFSRYDDPGRISAGEYVFLNGQGGGIGLLTTSRVTYTSSNFALSKVVYQNLFKTINDEYLCIGDIMRLAKVGSGSISANRNFVLIGDPALQLAYPKQKVITTQIIDSKSGLPVDTIKALQEITIKGEVQSAGQTLANFNGFLFPTIFDKSQQYNTLGNDPDSPVYTFNLQKNILYKGLTSVKNGKFEFTFIVPRDISYQYGFGKISYYATNYLTDANGYNQDITIGGSFPNAENDIDGPKIQLFMNDTLFVSGGITNQNPWLHALLFDEHGINTIGNGIGHDVTAILDENSSQPIVLNDYYQADLNNYQKGLIRYPFYNLADGLHTLSMKVWDVYNNSSDAYIEFIVASNQEVVIENLLNAPNPFQSETSFIFEHNQSCDLLNVQLLIYNTNGQLVRDLQAVVNSTGYQVGPDQLTWDGTNDYGSPLGQGVYIYQLKVELPNGEYEIKSNKLVLLR
jgi:hypothetical protein